MSVCNYIVVGWCGMFDFVTVDNVQHSAVRLCIFTGYSAI